ncbi:MAG: DNA recombination protein RmuC [Elusimicrobia bacterium]|nr:DNA recombination protein RmuC [Elusimicrobiota bacterium]
MTGAELVLILSAAAAGALLGALGLYGVAFSLRKKGEAERVQEREDLRGQFSLLSQEALSKATAQLLELASERLGAERARASAELDERRQAVESAVQGLGERLKSAEELVRGLERDREKKFGSLEEQLRRALASTDALRAATEGLQSLLSNSRVRGQWGERMADDLLRAAGFQENLQYVRNRVQDAAARRPDFTFLLPEGRKLHMDVKFPLDNYVRMADAPAGAERDRFKAEFVKDARARVRELERRDYVNPEEGTLDYLLCFIPNEQVYGFLNEAAPSLIDEALARKVVLCSPTTLYAMLAVVRQAHENFRFARATREVIQLVGAFQKTFETFRERFGKLGEQLVKTQDAYAEISGASFKRLEQAVARIDRVGRQDEGAPALPEPPGPAEPVKAETER